MSRIRKDKICSLASPQLQFRFGKSTQSPALAAKVNELAVGAGVPFRTFIEPRSQSRVRYVAPTAADIAGRGSSCGADAVARVRGHLPVTAAALPDARTLQLRGRTRRPAEQPRVRHRAGRLRQARGPDGGACGGGDRAGKSRAQYISAAPPGAIRCYNQIGRTGQTD